MTTYILGDIHGEYEKFVEILFHVNLVEYDDEGQVGWRSRCGDTLIQVGDMIDGADGSIACYNLLRRLQEEAQKEDGQVIRLIGNHELAYISPFKCTGMTTRTRIILTDTILLDVKRGTLVASCMLDDYIITHGGIHDNLLSPWNVIRITGKEFNDILVKDVTNNSAHDKSWSHAMFNIGKSRGGIHDISGIFWADWFRDTLANIKQIVGHTSVGGIIVNKKHINVDCGISRWAHQVYEILKYENNKFEVIKYKD